MVPSGPQADQSFEGRDHAGHDHVDGSLDGFGIGKVGAFAPRQKGVEVVGELRVDLMSTPGEN